MQHQHHQQQHQPERRLSEREREKPTGRRRTHGLLKGRRLGALDWEERPRELIEVEQGLQGLALCLLVVHEDSEELPGTRTPK